MLETDRSSGETVPRNGRLALQHVVRYSDASCEKIQSASAGIILRHGFGGSAWTRRVWRFAGREHERGK